METGHPEVVVAVVDSGIDLHHEDLEDKLAQGYDFVGYQGPRFLALLRIRGLSRSG